ncbi:MAG: DNA mismatch repair protein MutL, partial [Calditrichaeota bacterium]
MGTQNRIWVLPPEIANRIAAGEVVERPASVVKELVENAIDAGADDITIILKTGGKELIQVVDNGIGMSVEDLILAFQRHATSKIHDAEDLQAIQSLGFRGEALASIASVSRVEAKSVMKSEISGLQILLDGGKVIQQKPIGGPPGTSIAVKNLFYNTPARRKFLRADSTEYRHCLIAANRFALCYPEKQFTLVHNSEVIWEVKPQSLEERICAILGQRLKNLLIQVEDDIGAIKIHGFAGNQDTVRKQSGEQYLFLNGRYIQD